MWDWLFQFVGPLESSGIPYAIVGSVASCVYGEPRATNDVDLLIQLSRNDAAKLVHAFPSKQFYVPPAEVIAIKLGRPPRRTHQGHRAGEYDQGRFLSSVIQRSGMGFPSSHPGDRRAKTVVCNS